MCRSAEVRTAALYAVNVYISCELKELPDETLLTEQSLKCAEDGSVLVRTELLILLARFVERCAVARWRMPSYTAAPSLWACPAAHTCGTRICSLSHVRSTQSVCVCSNGAAGT
jgi:hypothetical protein